MSPFVPPVFRRAAIVALVLAAGIAGTAPSAKAQEAQVKPDAPSTEAGEAPDEGEGTSPHTKTKTSTTKR